MRFLAVLTATCLLGTLPANARGDVPRETYSNGSCSLDLSEKSLHTNSHEAKIHYLNKEEFRWTEIEVSLTGSLLNALGLTGETERYIISVYSYSNGSNPEFSSQPKSIMIFDKRRQTEDSYSCSQLTEFDPLIHANPIFGPVIRIW